MLSRLAADFLVLIHLGFILFVIGGGLLVIKRRWVCFFHLPAALWGALIEFQGWLCPLTPLEQHLRLAAGEQGYAGGFIQHYLLPLIYPETLTREIQLVLGFLVIAVNLAVYGWVLARMLSRKKSDPDKGNSSGC